MSAFVVIARYAVRAANVCSPPVSVVTRIAANVSEGHFADLVKLTPQRVLIYNLRR